MTEDLGKTLSWMKTEETGEVLHALRCERWHCSTGRGDPLLLREIL